ncbi:hypothetical protein RND81_08G203000 [Saponaria officinalis]|uniref:Uncharacterized protein n=1 Tax=Saponaria officinalis TaxID=3572 RepID=A0AAW1JA85_SAPOF
MEIVVLPPHDSLQPHFHHRRSRRNPNPRNPRKQTSPGPDQARPIRILKRGDNAVRPNPVSARSRPVLGPVMDGFYAGSSCVTSPPPSELPLPAFFARSCDVSSNNNLKIASDLRRVLKLC